MTPIVSVKLWNTLVGHLGYSPGQRRFATFEYDDAFTSSGVQPSPLVMPYPPRLHTFDGISERTFQGVPGIIADSLPDKFGSQLIDLFLAERGIDQSSVTTLDRLLYVGDRGVGALEYEPSRHFDSGLAPAAALNATDLAELANLVVSKKREQREKLLSAKTREQGLRLIRVGSSAGGARAKALVAEKDGKLLDGTVDQGTDAKYYLLKFDVDENSDRDGRDPPGMPRVEYVYAQLARELDINIPETRLLSDGDSAHFMIERFDREIVGSKVRKLHYASWCGLAHAHRDVTGGYGYEQVVEAIRRLDLGQKAVTEIFKRAIFNIVGRNQDDHTKNFGFLMDRGGEWHLAPAFDLTYAYDPSGMWTRSHQLRLSGKQDDFEMSDLLEFGKRCNLKERKAREIVDSTVELFASFESRAAEVGVSFELRSAIAAQQRLRFS